MSEPLISIIIPVLNGEPFLERCFATLDYQNYSNLEIIFVDNNSTDHSIKLVKHYCKHKKKAKMLRCKKQGPGAARNVGIKYASGEFISFLDVDDEIEPEKHNLLIQAFYKNPNVGMIVGNTIKKYTDGKQYKIDLSTLEIGINNPPEPGLLWMRQFQHHPHISAILIPKKVIEKVNYFPEDIFFGEDISLTVKIGMEFSVMCINDTISFYNRHPESSISQINQQITSSESYFQFYEKFALPFFYEKRKKDPYKVAYELSKKIAFKMLMKLIYKEKNEKFKEVLQELKKNTYLSNISLYEYIYFLFPFELANYTYQKLNKI